MKPFRVFGPNVLLIGTSTALRQRATARHQHATDPWRSRRSPARDPSPPGSGQTVATRSRTIGRFRNIGFPAENQDLSRQILYRVLVGSKADRIGAAAVIQCGRAGDPYLPGRSDELAAPVAKAIATEGDRHRRVCRHLVPNDDVGVLACDGCAASVSSVSRAVIDQFIAQAEFHGLSRNVIRLIGPGSSVTVELLPEPSEKHHITTMATYTISPGAEHGGFDVVIVGNDGARQTMPGFKTYAAAEVWVAEDDRRTNEEVHSSFRMQWRF
jgi:hypothetical protein